MNFLKSLVQKFTGKPVDWDELEESLIRADLGVPMTLRILKSLQERAHRSAITAADITEVAREEIGRILPIAPLPITPLPVKPKVLLIVGVNGTGKTTSTAKLAHFFKSLAVEMVRGQYNADPAALCYEAYEAADRKKIEFLICDTAGRLHTKSNLMAELSKVKRSLAKQDPKAPHETLLVVDATTGSNALAQTREFHQSVGLTGLIVTKLDGSGKGGIVIAIQDELGIPTRFIGTGEKLEDLALFDGPAFIEQMI